MYNDMRKKNSKRKNNRGKNSKGRNSKGGNNRSVNSKGGKSKGVNNGSVNSRGGKSYAPFFVKLDKVKYEMDAINQHKHRHGVEFSPLSGSEPKYDPKSWSSNRILTKHNCYSYALNQKRSHRKNKAQPGYFSGYKSVPNGKYNCDTFYKRLSSDSPSLFLTTFEYQCPAGFHKGFMAVDDNNNGPDYHFYRLDKDGYWSHKPGATPVTKRNASNALIKDPSKANRKYRFNRDYKDPCFFFCVNPKLSRDHSRKIDE